jgi:hypothetical protein
MRRGSLWYACKWLHPFAPKEEPSSLRSVPRFARFTVYAKAYGKKKGVCFIHTAIRNPLSMVIDPVCGVLPTKNQTKNDNFITDVEK